MSQVMPFNRVRPDQAGFDMETIAKLEAHFRRLIEKDVIQCASYMLTRRGDVFASGAVGKLKHDGDEPLKVDSIRRIASVSKLFTAVAVFQLVEQGKIFLRQPVAHWIEEFKHPLYENIQIWHLLSHTSGLDADGGYYTEPYPSGWWSALFAFDPDKSDEPRSEEEKEKLRKTAWIRALLSGKPHHAPGEQWSYSTNGYGVLGEIVSRVSGVPFETYILDKIIEPLGLENTFYDVPESLHDRVCTTNEHEGRRLRNERDTNDPYVHLTMPPRGGFGLYATLDDLCRFGNMLLNGGIWQGARILSRKSVERMIAQPLSNLYAYNWNDRIADMPHGLGPWKPRPEAYVPPGAYGHEGAGLCKLVIDPRQDAVVMFFAALKVDWSSEAVNHTENIIWSGWQ